jgi:Amt family ammonium transporter
MDKLFGIRVSPQEEIEGLDIGEHAAKGYPNFITADDTPYS